MVLLQERGCCVLCCKVGHKIRLGWVHQISDTINSPSNIWHHKFVFFFIWLFLLQFIYGANYIQNCPALFNFQELCWRTQWRQAYFIKTFDAHLNTPLNKEIWKSWNQIKNSFEIIIDANGVSVTGTNRNWDKNKMNIGKVGKFAKSVNNLFQHTSKPLV